MVCLIASSILAISKARDQPGWKHVQVLLIGTIAVYQKHWSTNVSRGKDWISPIKVFHVSAQWEPGFYFVFVEICLHFFLILQIKKIMLYTPLRIRTFSKLFPKVDYRTQIKWLINGSNHSVYQTSVCKPYLHRFQNALVAGLLMKHFI